MARDDSPSAAQAAASSDKATETLSQFVARLLDQLALSAWLPSAALVMLLMIVLELGTALDGPRTADDPQPLMQALRSVADISLGGALLAIGAVVVHTMVTQAFSFEAIRVLEGYWGTNRLIERIAEWRCNHHRRRQERLRRRYRRLTSRAWDGAHQNIVATNDGLRSRGQRVTVTPNVIEALRERVLGLPPAVKLSPAGRKAFENIEPKWQQWAPAETVRRRMNVDKRLRDYPTDPNRMLPTKLGNVLRNHEDDILRRGGATEPSGEDLETFVQRNFEDLPLSLKIEHDEQRTRLDLYCTMVFVLAFVTLVAAVRLAPHVRYAVSSVPVGILLMALMYRAGVATARAYGGILVVLAGYAEARTGRTEADDER